MATRAADFGAEPKYDGDMGNGDMLEDGEALAMRLHDVPGVEYCGGVRFCRQRRTW